MLLSTAIAVGAQRVRELITDPARRPLWDGNENPAEAAAGQRIRSVGEVFTVALTKDGLRENNGVESDEERRPAGRQNPGVHER
ncbi:hypothetical protein [Haloactinomyces albus]|uniref:Uncharacterized protein n=1 Tax=Haloactinomyces albus TaxID=1352928 RepID=A0AAE4CMP9_9ACTN|nr:hypothetical protein [Haloactinomyces albus]MDR7299833.1 hypothetical protein [Haloactinomyces albus]